MEPFGEWCAISAIVGLVYATFYDLILFKPDNEDDRVGVVVLCILLIGFWPSGILVIVGRIVFHLGKWFRKQLVQHGWMKE